MKTTVSIGQRFLATVNVIVGSGTVFLGVWAFFATLTDLDWKMSAYYLFAIAFGAFFVRNGWLKFRGAKNVPDAEGKNNRTKEGAA
jgi:hypothetical protein